MMPNIPYRLYMISRYLYLKQIPFLPNLFKYFIRLSCQAVIPYQAKIGIGTHFGFQGLGIVINRNCIIGKNVRIAHQVTIGGREGSNGAPIIGDNVKIGSGAKILGPIKIGDNVKIGANAVVINDVPEGSTAVGVPARVIRG